MQILSMESPYGLSCHKDSKTCNYRSSTIALMKQTTLLVSMTSLHPSKSFQAYNVEALLKTAKIYPNEFPMHDLLPKERIQLIRICLEVRDLIRYRSVSKLWKCLISESNFNKSHLEHIYRRDCENNKMGSRRIAMSATRCGDWMDDHDKILSFCLSHASSTRFFKWFAMRFSLSYLLIFKDQAPQELQIRSANSVKIAIISKRYSVRMEQDIRFRHY
uniref:F-box domain-containing protein n=1 Tax=Lactuca sativa TaxID=4236 RepID=A0A9R1XUB7_LACSA|nr:hypothetical protein LSAT_V11C100039540 [Lactuca sativa]